MIIVDAIARPRPGQRDQLLAACATVARATRADDGCLSYGFFADIEDPDAILGFEVWDSRAALDAHLSHSHTADFLTSVGPLLDGQPTLNIREVQASGNASEQAR